MDLRFYYYNSSNGTLTILGTVDNYSSFNFTRSFTGIGTWQLVISGFTENAKRIKNANMFMATEGVAGLITDFQETIDEQGITYVFSGVELKGIASKRIVLPPAASAYLQYTQHPEQIMMNLINTQILNPEDTDRKVYGTITGFADASASNISKSYRFDKLDESLSSLGETYAIGWYADIRDGSIHWEIFQGKNRTESQSENNKLILSYDRDTLNTSDLQYTKTIPNVALVAGQGEGTERAITYVGSGGGLERGEVYVDARDLEDASNLPERGAQKLAEYGGDTVYTITLSPQMVSQYRTAYDLGDIATIETDAFAADCILSEITEVYEDGALLRIDVTFGYDNQTISSAINRIVSNFDTLVKVEGSSSGGIVDYTELSNLPSINSVTLTGNKTSGDLGLAASSHNHDSRYYTESEIDTKLNGKANSSHTHTKSQITDFPTLATVATSGSYNDLSNKPTIPSIDGLLPKTGGELTGDLWLHTNSANYGSTLYFGDKSNVTISEPTNNKLNLKATTVNIEATNFTWNGTAIDTGGGDTLFHYGTSSTAASNQTKSVTCSTLTSLTTGASVRVRFAAGNTNTSPQLNVNSTGAKLVKGLSTTNVGSYRWQSGEVVDFVYDGTYWMMVKAGSATTSYYGITKLTSSISNTSNVALTPSAVYNLGIASGTWTPTVYGVNTTTSVGTYSKIGNVVTIQFYFTGTSKAGGTSSYIYVDPASLPYTPSNTQRWYGGGGTFTGGYCTANYVFSGWTIDTNSSNHVYPRTTQTATTAGFRSANYVYQGGSANTIYASGTIQYLTS